MPSFALRVKQLMNAITPYAFLVASVLIATLTTLALALSLSYSYTSINNLSRSSDYAVCQHNGLSKAISPDALLTMIVAPKSVLRETENTASIHHTRFVFQSWKELKNIEFIVVSHDCATLRLAKECGLATFIPSSGNDAEDFTYRYMFKMIDTIIPSSSKVVGFSNGDIIYDSTLLESVKAMTQYASDKGLSNWLFAGSRTNVDLPDILLSSESPFRHRYKKMLQIASRSGLLFQSDAQVHIINCPTISCLRSTLQDFFIFNRGIDIAWDCIPPFLVGGVYFDNWFSGLSSHHPNIIAIDFSNVINAYHVNHGRHRSLSRVNAASAINLIIGHDAKNFISNGYLNEMEWVAKKNATSGYEILRRHRLQTSSAYDAFISCQRQGGPTMSP